MAKHGVRLLPVDSEHSAPPLAGESAKSLTESCCRSGSPFFGMKTEELRARPRPTP
ncbi:hypothetical protein [Faecalibacterium hattorii]|uniref:hypothetical protein n=1 Tax=Faecalibacterium hattorii TaxID=2935520 RepID=UPI003AAAF9D4